MADVLTSGLTSKGVGDPNAIYDWLLPYYGKARAIVGGELAAKQYDGELDNVNFGNLLIPFSENMTQKQYNFYKAEAELPGLCSQYTRVLVSGLLRKRPDMVLPEDVDEGAYDWIMSNFTQEGGSLIGFLAEILEEEIITSGSWVGVTFPYVPDNADMSPEQRKNLKPYPYLLAAEAVINWKEGINPVTGEKGLVQVVVKQLVEKYDTSEFHPDLVDTVFVHEINDQGQYQIRVYEKVNGVAPSAEETAKGLTGDAVQSDSYRLARTDTNIRAAGQPLDFIPLYPLNGSVKGTIPILMPLVDRETALYNKVSRRNHLMYGAATYTPVIESDMQDEELDQIAAAGLGSWLRVRVGESISVMETPTDALKDMDRAIQDALMEIARMGIRMMAPDVRDQSGVALEIRNAAQTAQLGTLNVLISQTIRTIISVMLNWRYGSDYSEEDITFNLAPDFNPAPLGADWLRLVTEWYDMGKIPRETWLDILKANDIIPNDYDDDEARQSIEQDDLIMGPPEKQREMRVEEVEELARISANQNDSKESTNA